MPVPVCRFSGIRRLGAVFLCAVAFLSAPTTADASQVCTTRLADWAPDKLGQVETVPFITDTSPIATERFGDWFVGFAPIRDTTTKTGFYEVAGVLTQVRYSGDLTGTSIAWMTFNKKSGSYSLTMMTNSASVDFRKAEFRVDGTKYEKYRYRKRGRTISGRRWSTLNKKHIRCGLFSNCTIGWRFHKNSLRRARSGWTLNLRSTSGRMEFEAVLSLDGFTKAAQRARKLATAEGHYAEARKLDKERNHVAALAKFTSAADAGLPRALAQVHYARYFLADRFPEKLKEAGYSLAQYRATARQEAVDAEKHTSLALGYTLSQLFTNSDFGPVDRQRAKRALERAAARGSSVSSRTLARYLTADEAFPRARGFLANATTLGRGDSKLKRRIDRDERHAFAKCAEAAARSANTVAALEQFQRWYPERKSRVMGTLVILKSQAEESERQSEEAAKKAEEKSKARARLEQREAEQLRQETAIWAIVSKSKNPALLRKFAADFPDSQHRPTAEWLASALETAAPDGSNDQASSSAGTTARE